MNVLRFLLRKSPGTVILAIVAACISGAVTIGLLAIVNVLAASRVDPLTWGIRFAALCAVVLGSGLWAHWLLVRLTNSRAADTRLELTSRLVALPLRDIERVGPARVLAALTDDVDALSGALASLPMLCSAVAMQLATMVYLAVLSPKLLALLLLLIFLALVTFRLPEAKAHRSLSAARSEHANMLKDFRALGDGAKELRLSQERRADYLARLTETTRAHRDHRTRGELLLAITGEWGRLLFFLIIGVVLFGAQSFPLVDPDKLPAAALATLYLGAAFPAILDAMPRFSRAGVALHALEELLGAAPEPAARAEPRLAASSALLELDAVTYAYTGFCLGPITLTLRPGKIVFIAGGNGSGKSTLAKVLTGLYPPDGGELRVNGEAVTDANRTFYRQHFSAVFVDAHVFENIAAARGPERDEEARRYIARLGLEGKVEVASGVFSTTTALSDGQRKRLALVVAYLEDRPVYVFDEWAAHQDPLFKKFFYGEVLPELRARGKTVVVISHDDQYFGVADELIKLEEGRLSEAPTLEFMRRLCGASLPPPPA